MPQSPLVRILLLLVVAAVFVSLSSGIEPAAGSPDLGSLVPEVATAAPLADGDARRSLSQIESAEETTTGPTPPRDGFPEESAGSWTLLAGIADVVTAPALGTAVELIEQLRPDIAEPDPNRPRYSRDQFAGWLDIDGDCVNTRDEVLQAESIHPPTMTANGCAVASGLWYDAYTERTYTNPQDLHVDHVVALKDAWDSGAWSWLKESLDQFSNDLDNLNAIAASENLSKSARGPADYSPSAPGALCGYLVQYATVKITWQLSITHQDFEKIEKGLPGCTVGSVPNARVTPQPAPPAAISPQPTGGCHPAYEPCLPDLPGDALNCDDLSPDQKPVTVIRPDPNSSYPRSLLDELNQKPVTVIHPDTDPYRLDRDGDGRGCTS